MALQFVKWALVVAFVWLSSYGVAVPSGPLAPAQDGRIRGLIYADANEDGQYIPGEALVDGAQVQLWQNNEKLQEWVTDEDGVFLFDTLAAGRYTVIETPPPGWSAPTDTYVVDVVDGQTTQLFIPNYELIAILISNYRNGAPGSFFTIQGVNFPIDDTGTIMVNGQVLGTIATDDTGGFFFILSTQGAHTGRYIVTVEVNPLGRVLLDLDHNAPLRPKEGDWPVFQIPPGIALHTTYYVPLVSVQPPAPLLRVPAQ